MAGWETEQRTRLPDKRPESFLHNRSVPPHLLSQLSFQNSSRAGRGRACVAMSSPSPRPRIDQVPTLRPSSPHSCIRIPLFSLIFAFLISNFIPRRFVRFFFFICPPRFYVLEMTATSFAPQFSTSSVLFWPFG